MLAQYGQTALCQRNRYYDSSTGQFTPQDPIGIAGGLNLYGYANGDPVNFHDPFGLECEERDEPTTQAMSKECDEALMFFGIEIGGRVGKGGEVAVGVVWDSAEEGLGSLGVYSSVGVGAGLGGGPALEGGYATSRAAFEGASTEICGGVGGGSCCAAFNQNGYTHTVTGGSRFRIDDLVIPVTTSGGGRFTDVGTLGGLGRLLKRTLNQAEAAIESYLGIPQF